MALQELLKKVLEPLEKKGERELQRMSHRLQACLLREGAKLIAEEQPQDLHPGDQAEGCGRDAPKGRRAPTLSLKKRGSRRVPNRKADRALCGVVAPPEPAAAAVQSETLPASASAGAAEPPPTAAPDSTQLEVLSPDKAEGRTVVQRSPEVSEIFQSQPLVEGSHAALSCFIAGYFPPELTVTWLRRERGERVAQPIEDSMDYAIVPKETCARDGETYQQRVTLFFSPSVQRDQGVEFLCRVGHVALQTPIERSTGTLEVKGAATPDSKEVTPESQEVASATEEITSISKAVPEVTAVSRDIAPDARDASPVSRDLAPDTSEVTSVSIEVTPDSGDVTAVSGDITPDTREMKPISGEGRGHEAGRNEIHFVDRHREQLIQRVTLVEGILDKLLGSVLDHEQYQTILAERTNPMRMRKLYEFMLSWNRYCKDQLYKALADKCKFLVADLEGK
nr:uncharacterized protein LOC102458637 isoform X2 [Pelodiscus sinensis]|eukprot:XP_006111006.1 uncharacterized protein LOC102458637 isoform X2 [Pelodiscus sinensis]